MKNLSMHQATYNIFKENSNQVFNSSDLLLELKKQGIITKKNIITMVLTRLCYKNLISRTPVQLTKGFYYSHSNTEKLEELYQDYLLPSYFENRRELLTEIDRTEFEKLNNNYELNIQKEGKFIQKYPLTNFEHPKVLQFLAMLTGFSMCDGHIGSGNVHFFFRRRLDAELFAKDFRNIFNQENPKIKKATNGESYIVEICKSTKLAKLLQELGSKKGNKVFQSFLIPKWIYHGPNEIKRTFLSTIIGNEGSAPTNNRWRIQFVLSKSKEHVSNLIAFLNQIRTMLKHFEISTSHIQLRKQKERQFCGRFYIKGKENLHKFYNQFSFLYTSEKQEVLEDLIKINR